MTDTNIFSFFDDILAATKKRGADSTELLYSKSVNQSEHVRMGKAEETERAEEAVLGIKIRQGKKEAAITCNDKTMAAVAPLLDKLFAMVTVLPDNPFAGEADPAQLFKGKAPDLEAFDPTELTAAQLQELARAVEDAARGEQYITNSEGANASFGKNQHWFAFSNGFRGQEYHSHFSLGVSIIAGKGSDMESDYDYSSKVFFEDLLKPEVIGKEAARRAVRALGGRQEKSGQLPVIIDKRIATSFIGNLARAINGNSIAKGTSFLQGKLGEVIMNPAITIIDNPLRKRGFASQSYDGEGLPTSQKSIVDKGVLTTYVLDLATARQLKMTPTGHANRSLTGVYPSLTNVHMTNGQSSLADLMADIKEGLYITRLMGFGVNGVTGDYSQGASGFWIVNGELAHSVNEMTVAGNLKDIFMNLTPANDLEFIHHNNAPSLRIDGLTIAGK
ncbi:MAG: TldD/PmbA family protein [Alphaproteobacteria bacterium]|nr:TldD/PmbA family protein [Alphaproteobacteria bacterium]